MVRRNSSRQGYETANQYSYSSKDLNVAKLENRLYAAETEVVSAVHLTHIELVARNGVAKVCLTLTRQSPKPFVLLLIHLLMHFVLRKSNTKMSIGLGFHEITVWAVSLESNGLRRGSKIRT